MLNLALEVADHVFALVDVLFALYAETLVQESDALALEVVDAAVARVLAVVHFCVDLAAHPYLSSIKRVLIVYSAACASSCVPDQICIPAMPRESNPGLRGLLHRADAVAARGGPL